MTDLPRCPTCGRQKAPRGRDLPIHKAGSYCDPDDCPDYCKEPRPVDRWPEEPENWADWNMRMMTECLGDDTETKP
jgi:hypothetical protein